MNAIVHAGPYQHLDEMLPWNDQTQLLECVGVVDEAPEVKTFIFRSDSQTWFRYKPGQFITLELPADSGPLMRTYTLSSSPSRPFSISVTVKAQADSIGTRWMFDNLRAGVQVKAHGPAGNFSIHEHPSGKYLFISAGSGVTPMMSMLRWLNDCAPLADVSFVSCARRPDDIIFRKELELLGMRMPSLSLGFLVEERTSRESWFGHVGRIDHIRLPLLVSDFREREIFCCGPDPFMRAVRDMLGAAGFDMARYHQESFAAPPVEPAPVRAGGAASPATSSPAPAAGTTVSIHFSRSGVECQCLPGQTILQAARAAGVRIASACEYGLCGTCKVKCTGDVEMNHNGGILDRDIADGFILACCSRPLSAVEIEA